MFGEKLKKLRTDNRLIQDELAEKILVTLKVFIHKVEWNACHRSPRTASRKTA